MTTSDARLRDLAISESGFVFDPLTGSTFTVNATGLAVLQSLKSGRGPKEIVTDLTEHFDCAGDEDLLSRDVGDYLAALKEQGLVR